MSLGLWIRLTPNANREELMEQNSIGTGIAHDTKDLETLSEKRAEFNRLAESFANIYNNKKAFYVTEVIKTLPREEALQKIQDRIRELENFIYSPQVEAIALRDLYSETIKHATEEEKEYLRKRDNLYKPKARTPENSDKTPKLTPFETAVKVLMDTMQKIGMPITKDEAIKRALAQGVKQE